MQFSPRSGPAKAGRHVLSIRPGDDVIARGARWLVVDVRAYDDCRLVTLTGAAPPFAGEERRLLHPFDTIASTDRPAHPRIVSGARWRAACRAAIAADTPSGSLREARAAGIDLMAHQLEPALAVLAGLGTRVLLADEVGLGKTIQAGLILRELLGRAWIERVLVLTPAGLRDQWIHELSSRFGIAAASGDAKSLRHLTATLPLGMNPWSALAAHGESPASHRDRRGAPPARRDDREYREYLSEEQRSRRGCIAGRMQRDFCHGLPGVVVASTDYVKRAEVLPAVAACRWDVVVVDEAHGTAGDTDRRAAVHALASRASYVVLLTATPHSGDRAAFASLCGLGSAGDDALLVFRRRRTEVRGGHLRRVRTLRVRPSAAERAMYAALTRYSDAVRAERGSDGCLALSVLHKRAFSSPWSLAQSVARQLTLLDRDVAAADAEQLALPLGDPDGEQTPADQPPDWPSDLGLADPIHDRRLLTALLESSRAAAGAERKLCALRRLLGRVQEKAIVFTEYRDTLRHVQRVLERSVPIVTLHGGMTHHDRAAALAEFERRSRGVLLATDAAGEGLNLQGGCRLVVNLELPWNPMRLEQRIGRVDRIGQTRTVHAVHLVADGTGEMRILERLQARVAQAQADIGVADPVSGWDAVRTARFVVAGECGDIAHTTAADCHSPNVHLETHDLRSQAMAEVARLESARAVVARIRHPISSWLPCQAPLIVRSARAKLRAALGSKALLVWRLSWEDRAGRAIESHLATVTIDGVPRQLTSSAMRRTVQALAEHVAPAIESLNAEWRESSAAAIRAVAAARLVRERAILAATGDEPFEQFQPGLFDRRAERLQHLVRQEAEALKRQLSDRIASVELTAATRASAPALVFAVLP